jgi:hypothetical protein
MGKNKISPNSGSQRDLLRDLLASMGKADANRYEIWQLEMALEEIKRDWLARGEVRSVGSDRKLLREFRVNTARRLELRKQLGPLREDILLVGFKQANPGADERVLREGLEQVDYRPEVFEAQEDQDIADLIDSMSDFRKRQVRKLVVERFLLLLEKFGVVPHPKRLPLSRMMHALFDWLGIEQAQRPTDSGVRTIERNLRKRDQRD